MTWTTADVQLLLKERYSPPAWAIFFEVANATGMNQQRKADAVAMGLYPSQGLEIHGFEIKVTRGDWLRELKEPSKSNAVARHCDRFWLVAPHGTVKAGELPAPWGFLEVKGEPGSGTLRRAKQAQLVTEALNPTLSRSFVAALVRRACESATALTDAERQAIERKARQAGVEQGRGDRKTGAEAELRLLKETVAAFERASGIKLDPSSWRTGQIGEAVARVMKGERFEGIVSDLERRLEDVKLRVASLAVVTKEWTPEALAKEAESLRQPQ